MFNPVGGVEPLGASVKPCLRGLNLVRSRFIGRLGGGFNPSAPWFNLLAAGDYLLLNPDKLHSTTPDQGVVGTSNYHAPSSSAANFQSDVKNTHPISRSRSVGRPHPPGETKVPKMFANGKKNRGLEG